MNVGTNMSAVKANSILKRSDNSMTKSLERLSSGLKINHAKDNPAGIAIGKRMKSQINGLSIASDNAGDAVNIIETADGALGEIHAILQRMNELAVQASTGTNTSLDRTVLESELTQLKDEITRIAESTDFNGQPLLDGSFDLKGYSSDSNAKVAYYSDEVEIGEYILSATTATDADGNIIVDTISGFGGKFPPSTKVDKIKGDMVTLKADNGFEMTLQIKADVTDVSLDIKGIGAMRMQIGANEGQVLAMRIPETSERMLGITNTSIVTEEKAKEAIDDIKDAINYVASIRARLGAYQNRLESAGESLDVSEENMTSSYSAIMDLDMAEEMTEYTTNQVLVQSGVSMLAQANERPQQILQLLQ